MPKIKTLEEISLCLLKRNIKFLNYDRQKRLITTECLKCSHIWTAHYTNILNNNHSTGCPECNSFKKIELSLIKTTLLKNGLELIGEYKGARHKLKYKCNLCNYIGENSYSNIKHQNQGCPKCKKLATYTNEEVDYLLLDRNKKIIRIDDIQKNSNKIKWKCLDCNRFFCSTATSIITHNTNCPFCGFVSTSKKEDRWLDMMHIPIENRRYKINFENRWISVDGIDKETNTIYEFYGDFWHGNPQRFNRDEINTVCKKTYGQLYDKTIEREDFLKSKGFNIITIWESEFNEVII